MSDPQQVAAIVSAVTGLVLAMAALIRALRTPTPEISSLEHVEHPLQH